MKYLKLIFFVSLVLSYTSCQQGVPLFENNGNRDWIQKGDAKWEFSDDEITATLLRGSGFIMTKEVYEDFELELQFYPDETINSGIFVRCSESELSYTDCYEINIWDDHPDQNERTGAIVSRAKPILYVETTNTWNTYTIRCKGNRIKAWINGNLTADLENDDLGKGYIALQAAGLGTVRFRNIVLTVL
ncbi:3-keto-disaccharide hydrolase [Maribacter aestuarii]|uniref:3-keto-disaccharide hydrolase n=1 Tax=Maribacter aestuarii TaxID=1130723 RepID=UPI00248B3648|nr:DUF1080 domain-containing protein [Maribacter aestuarii]